MDKLRLSGFLLLLAGWLLNSFFKGMIPGFVLLGIYFLAAILFIISIGKNGGCG